MQNSNGLSIPDRWLRCPRKGQLVAGKFLPFKTPLDARYNSQVSEEYRFDLQLLFSSLRCSPFKLGLIIDLTNTKRFYNKDEIEKECKYIKLSCRGHGQTPTVEQTNEFIEICDRFIRTDPLHVIGVHCTHGFNRTGFLIASYLVEKMDWGVGAATKAFAASRPPGIYKQDYLRELFNRFGEGDDVPAAPVRPEWCLESSNDADDDEDAASDGREATYIIKKDAKFMEGKVPSVTVVTALNEVKFVQQTIKRMCNWQKNGFPGAQPVSMDCSNIQLLAKVPYKVSWKADGVRYMMLIDVYAGKNRVYMVDRDNVVYSVPKLRFPRIENPSENICKTLLDGEMVIDMFGSQVIPRYLVYDVITLEGEDFSRKDFNERLYYIDRKLIIPRNGLPDEEKNGESFRVRLKQFFDLQIAKKLLDEKFAKQISHEVDGLVFQPIKMPYTAGRCLEMLKWKPADQNSIDFKLLIVVKKQMGCLPETVGNLHVLHYEPPFSTIKVTPDLKQYHNKIVECRYDFRSKSWIFMRERTDKSFPNAYTTAAAVWDSILKPVTKDMLFQFTDRGCSGQPPVPQPGHGHPPAQPPAQQPSRPPVPHQGPPSTAGSQNGARPSLKRPGEDLDRTIMPPPAKIPNRV